MKFKNIIFILLITLTISSLIFSQTKLSGNSKLRGNAKGHKNPPQQVVGPLQAGDSVYPIGFTSNVRDGGSITASVIGTQTQTISGTISSCINDTSGSWRRWCNTDFASGTDGWIAEDRLRRTNSAQGAKSILLMRFVFSDHTGDANPSNANINTYLSDANSVFTQYSYGQITSVTGTIAPSTGSFTLPHNVSFYSAILASDGADGLTAALLNDAHTIALANGFDWTTYFHNMIWIPQDYGIGYTGGALYRGAVMTTTFQDNGYSVIPSMLDRLGMPERANAWNSNDSTVFGSAGTSVPNGDPFDIFGTESLESNFNLYHKNFGSKWIPDANVHQVTANGTYRIYALDTETTITAGRFYGIRMPSYINSGFCATCTEYFIEYRQDVGLVINWGGKQLLDMVPSTETFSDATLTVTLSPFTDPASHTISVSAPSGSTPKFVDVTIGGL